MDKENKSKKTSLVLLFLVGVVFLIFILLAYTTVSRSSFFTSSTQDRPSKGAVYQAPEGRKIYYDPEYVTPEDIEKMIELQKKMHEFEVE